MRRRWLVLLGLFITIFMVLVAVFGFEQKTAIRWSAQVGYSGPDGQGLPEKTRKALDAALHAGLEEYQPRPMYRGMDYRVRQLREAGEVWLPVVSLREYRVTYGGEDFVVVSAFGRNGGAWHILVIHEYRRLRWIGRGPDRSVVELQVALGDRVQKVFDQIWKSVQ